MLPRGSGASFRLVQIQSQPPTAPAHPLSRSAIGVGPSVPIVPLPTLSSARRRSGSMYRHVSRIVSCRGVVGRERLDATGVRCARGTRSSHGLAMEEASARYDGRQDHRARRSGVFSHSPRRPSCRRSSPKPRTPPRSRRYRRRSTQGKRATCDSSSRLVDRLAPPPGPVGLATARQATRSARVSSAADTCAQSSSGSCSADRDASAGGLQPVSDAHDQLGPLASGSALT